MSTFNVLIVEDEALVALMMQMLIEDQGWVALGPMGTVAKSLEALDGDQRIDCALLDLNLRGETSLPVADVLAARNIPFAFTSGYGAAGVEPRFAGRPVFAKPVDESQVRKFLSGVAASVTA